jgi:drug/metabolite transporter (DMT)-like permease
LGSVNLARIALCVVVSAAIAAAGIGLVGGRDNDGSGPNALGLLLSAAVAAAIAFAIIAVTPWLLATAVCDIGLPTHSLFAFWRREHFSNSIARTMALLGFAVMVLTIGGLTWATSRNRGAAG